MSEAVLAKLEAEKPSMIQHKLRLVRYVPETPEGCYRLAVLLIKGSAVPRSWPTTPEGVMVCLIAGFERGLNLTQTLAWIMVVNGRPTLWGDGALAMVRQHETCGSIKEWFENGSYHCRCIRNGEPEPIVRSFSEADAKKAGLWGKAGPWSQYPLRMLQMRARAFALRDAFPDVLGGLGIAEEVMDHSIPEAATTQVSTAQSKIDELPELPDAETTTIQETKTVFDVDEIAAQMGDKK